MWNDERNTWNWKNLLAFFVVFLFSCGLLCVIPKPGFITKAEQRQAKRAKTVSLMIVQNPELTNEVDVLIMKPIPLFVYTNQTTYSVRLSME